MDVLDLNNLSSLSGAGLVWGIAGTWFLGRAFSLSDDVIRRQAGTYFDLSPPALRALCEQRIDARVGLSCLGVGFLLQAFSAFGIQAAVGFSIFLCTPALFVAMSYYREHKIWTLRDTLRIGRSGASLEEVWRRHFLDVSQLRWEREWSASSEHIKKH
ncbi:MAG: hypothetical protein ACI9GK_002576 [Devosia sp.]|jgi:hypothetical protein